MPTTRRDVLLHGLLGAGGLGLRALATGLPAAFLLQPKAATADAQHDDERAQFLILSTSYAGDPVNANTPGTYEHAAIQHSADPRMARTPLRLRDQRVYAAAPWASLPQPVLDRTVFFHHSTLVKSHPQHAQVLALLGAAAESVPAFLCGHLAGRLHTRTSEPIVLGVAELATPQGQPLPRLLCTELRDALTAGRTPLGSLATLRDQSLDELHRSLRTANKAQRAYVDRHARSRAEAAAAGDRLGCDLSAIRDDGVQGQIAAAAALVQLQAAPVVVIHIPFGGDNHFDYDFAAETAQTLSGVAHIAQLMQRLQDYGLGDRASFALLNVFGRTLQRHGRAGRDHWAAHHTAVLIGKPFAGGVIGGLMPYEDDFAATPIRTRSGEVPLSQTLPALGKTLARGLGLPPDLLESSIRGGQVIDAALV